MVTYRHRPDILHLDHVNLAALGNRRRRTDATSTRNVYSRVYNKSYRKSVKGSAAFHQTDTLRIKFRDTRQKKRCAP